MATAKRAGKTKKARKAQRHSELHTLKGRYLGDMVYGGLDGIITTFAVVNGVTGASLSSFIVLILGLANLLADGFSMGTGDYLATKSEQSYYKREEDRERWEVENVPEDELEEIKTIYSRKGFKGRELEKVVKTICSNEDTWVKTMMLEELKMIRNPKSPIKAGLVTFMSFVVFGFVPLLSYISVLLLGLPINPFTTSVILTMVILMVLGSVRSLLINKSWYATGLEMVVVGGLAALVSYYVGFLASGFLG